MKINRFLELLKPDFSNVDEVYNKLLIEYNPDNETRTQKMFIDSIEYDNTINDNELLKENYSKLSTYLGQKICNIEWYKIDYYNRYIIDKEFGFMFLFTYFTQRINNLKHNKVTSKKNISYKDFKNEIRKHKIRFYYIFEKLDNIDSKELKINFLQQLNDLKKIQVENVIINEIENLINEIEKHEKHDYNKEIELKKYDFFNEYCIKDMFNLLNKNRTENQDYYLTIIKNYTNNLNNEVETYKLNNENKAILKDFNERIKFLMERIFSTCQSVYKCKNATGLSYVASMNDIKRNEFDLKNYLSYFYTFHTSIIYKKNTGIDLKEILFLKNYFIDTFNKTIRRLKYFQIDISKSPFNSEIEKILNDFENIISLKEIEIFNKTPQPEAPQQIEKEYTSRNKPKEITAWFKVGIFFLSGKINELMNSNDNNASKVARLLSNDMEFKEDTIRVNITNNISENGNIFEKKNFIKIYDYCIENQLPILEKYKDKYNKYIQLD